MPQITPLYVGVSGYIADVCRRLETARMVNRMVSWDETQWKVSPGALTVALVVNILTQRRPLYRVWESFERLDLPALFDEPVTLDNLNDDAFGRTLDRLHASGNLRRLIHSVALRATRLLPLGIRCVHAGTTSISVAGEYELTGSDRAFLEERPVGYVLDIRHGYSKDRRPDLKQFICGLVVSGEGLPLLGTVQDGNTSDKVWNSQIIDEIQQSFLDPQKVIYVADSALITAANLDKMAQHKMRFISRLLETYRAGKGAKTPHPNAACRTHRRAHSRGACQSQHLRPHYVAFGSGALELLAYLFLLALIVVAYIEIKIRQELKVRHRQFVVPGNRLTNHPTMTSIFDIMQTVLVALVHTPEGVQRILPSNTDPRVYQILELTGLDPTAYTTKR